MSSGKECWRRQSPHRRSRSSTSIPGASSRTGTSPIGIKSSREILRLGILGHGHLWFGGGEIGTSSMMVDCTLCTLHERETAGTEASAWWEAGLPSNCDKWILPLDMWSESGGDLGVVWDWVRLGENSEMASSCSGLLSVLLVPEGSSASDSIGSTSASPVTASLSASSTVYWFPLSCRRDLVGVANNWSRSKDSLVELFLVLRLGLKLNSRKAPWRKKRPGSSGRSRAPLIRTMAS